MDITIMDKNCSIIFKSENVNTINATMNIVDSTGAPVKNPNIIEIYLLNNGSKFTVNLNEGDIIAIGVSVNYSLQKVNNLYCLKRS